MKVVMSKCQETPCDEMMFICVICGEKYILDVISCEGVVCCDCQNLIRAPNKIVNNAFKVYKNEKTFYNLTMIYTIERLIRGVRGYLEMISK